MSSLVEELQRDALNPDVRVSNLLRKAKTIAVKLDLPELAAWVEKELNGYHDCEVPEYRRLRGRVKGRNPFHGWQPVVFADAEIEDAFSKQPIGQRVAELEHVIGRNDESQLMITLNSQAKQLLMQLTGMDSDFMVFVSGSGPVGILDAVRTALLDWSLKLEQSGIKGEGMSFSSEEREKAHETHATYNIGNIQTFTGNMGSGSGSFSVESNVVNGDNKAAILDLVRQIKENENGLGLSLATKNNLDSALDGLHREMSDTKPNPSTVRNLLASIRNIAEGAAGSLVAQGILSALGNLNS
ncbi:MAG: Uncharacterized protein JWM43_398 [Acidobacteriaceae bacterium]|nr:Uncharacterized protein [Acidobacteriaceae bacterium]